MLDLPSRHRVHVLDHMHMCLLVRGDPSGVLTPESHAPAYASVLHVTCYMHICSCQAIKRMIFATR